MGTIFKIALRNLTQHRTKTLIVGALITLGIGLTFVGNTVFESVSQGVKRGYSENFTGDIMIKAQSKKVFSLFGSEDFSSLDDLAVPVIQNYSQVLDALRATASVSSFTSVVSGYATLNFEAQGQALDLEDLDRGDPMFGIEPESYFKTFPGIKILEGRTLQSGESGILMSRSRLDQIATEKKVVLKVGDEIHLNVFGDSGLKLRVVPLVGIYQFASPNKGFEEIFTFVDVQTMRSLDSMIVGSKDDVKLDASIQSILTTSSDDFFDDTVDKVKPGSTVDLNGILGDKTLRKSLQTIDNGAWHDILIRLKPDSDIPGTIAGLNASFTKANIPVVAVNWKGAAGFPANMTDLAQVLFNLVILILTIVAVIIIINTLVISVMERMPEIGTMRALGAQRSFIRKLFTTETLLMAGVFGLIGIGLGTIGVLVIDLLKIPIDNDALQMVFSATKLDVQVSLKQVAFALFNTAIIGVVSSVYPVSVALKVSPLKAITTE